MKLIKSKVEILDELDGNAILKKIERIARTCYKSEDRISDDTTSATKMVRNLLASGHEAMIEHFSISVKFTCDRGVSHEIVRHRVASFAQESTRYCNYSKDKFSNELTFIIPSNLNIPEGTYNYWDGDWCDVENLKILVSGDVNQENAWLNAVNIAEKSYLTMINNYNWKAQEAKSILPNCLKTELNMTANLREWRHFFKLRCDTPAHPDMRKLALELLVQMHEQVPVIFDDLYEQFITELK